MKKSYSDEVNFSKFDPSEFKKPTAFTKSSPDTKPIYGNDSRPTIKDRFGENYSINSQGLVVTSKKSNFSNVVNLDENGENGKNGNDGKILTNINGSKINSKAFKLDGKSGKLGSKGKNTK